MNSLHAHAAKLVTRLGRRPFGRAGFNRAPLPLARKANPAMTIQTIPLQDAGDTVEGQRLNVVGFPGQAERQTQDECGGQLPVEFHVPILPRLNLNSQPREVAA